MKKLTTLKLRNRTASRNLALGLLLSVGSLFSYAQTVTTSVATGTGTSAYVPIYGNYGYTYSQQIYLASDFSPLVAGQPSIITKIRFFNVTGSVQNSTNWTVFMGNTSQASFPNLNATSWVAPASLTQVFTGTLSTPAANSWVELVLTTPFTWDGVSNLVVAVDENTSGWSTGDIYWRTQTTAVERSMQYRNDSNNPDPANPPAANGRYAAVPQMQFVHAPTVTCSAAPTHATAVTSVSTTCSNSPQSVDLSLTGTPFVTGLSFQWQYNSGPGWVNYPAGTTSPYAAFPTQTVNVRAITTCIATNQADTSDEASITVSPAPTLALNQTSVAYCTGAPVSVVATGANTYAWTPATGLNVTNNDTVIANPANPTTYTLIGTDLAGCKDTATVFVTPLNKVQRTASYTPTTLCEPGTAVTITAAVSPATISGGSTFEYRFVDATGAVLQNWGTNNVYTFTPGADSVYNVYSDFRSSTCPDAIDSISTPVVVGFGADVATVDYDCINLGGSVTLSSVFGQTAPGSVYTNPFATAADVTSVVTLSGSAAITDGRAVLTPSATSVNGSVTINEPTFQAGLNNALTVSFKMTADLPVGPYNTGGADGISYSFGNDVGTTGNQNGTGSKLRLSFDANENSPNMPGIYLTYGFNGATLAPANAIIHVNNLDLWKIKQDVPVVLTINASGRASLTVDGTVVFENIQMPPAYMNANTTGWKHVFGAATGGDGMRQAISEVSITSPAVKYALVNTNVAPATWQNTPAFTNVQPGTYDVWMSSNGTTSCAQKIETVEIVNTNPLVELGNDTTICEGESLILNAGNAGATYVWSNSQITTQTREVTQAGPYVVNVTAANGCIGVGSINIGVMAAPTASTIFVQNNMPTYTFTIMNPENADQYSWNFGDGTTIANAPGTVTYTYTTAGPKMVSVTLTNECGTETVVATIVVTSTASIATNEIEGLNVYPNPASERVVVELPTAAQAIGSVYNTTGSLVKTIESFTAKTEVSVSDLTPGVYFLNVQSEEKTSIVKLVVE